MSSFPLVKHIKQELKALSIADAYADVLALVIRGQFCEPPAKDPYLISIDITLGRGLCLARFLNSTIKSVLATLSEIEKICIKHKATNLSLTTENQEQLLKDIKKMDKQFIDFQNQLKSHLEKHFNEIPLFPKAGKRVTITLLHKANTSFTLTLPDLGRIIDPVLQIADLEMLSLTLQQNDKNIKIALLEPLKKMLNTISDQNLQQTNLLAQAGETYYLVKKENNEASRSIESLESAMKSIKKIQPFMLEKPKLVQANQANANKAQLINARRYKDDLQ